MVSLYLALVVFLCLVVAISYLFWKNKHLEKENTLFLQSQHFSEKSLQRELSDKNEVTQKLEITSKELTAIKSQKAVLDNTQEQANTKINDLITSNTALTTKLDQAKDENLKLITSISTQETLLNAEKDKITDLKKQFEQQKDHMKQEFKIISTEILKEREESLTNQNKEGIGTIIKPLQDQIRQFQQRTNEIHTETIKGNTSLEVEIKNVMDVGLKMRDDASNLTSVLKGDSRQRGAWGETQLERTLEVSGLLENDHYEKQSSFRDQNGQRKQTDFIIKIPGKKQLIIDSKVSLIAYDKYIASSTNEEKTKWLSEHVKSVKRHIDDLSSKDYTNLIGINSPSYILMFMAIEPAYIEAMKHDSKLIIYGMDKNIVLVSHTSLTPVLRVVADLWRLEQSNRYTKEVSQKAGDIYNTVCMLAQRMNKLGQTLNTTSTHYNDAVKALTGKQGLQGKVQRFEQLSNKISKEMPSVEMQNLDYDTSSLEAIAIPVKE